MNIRQRIILLVALAFVAIAAIGGYAIAQSRISAASVKALTEGVVPSALAASDLVASIKDVQLTAVAMVSASEKNSVEQAAQHLQDQRARILASVETQGKQADSDAQRGLIEQTRESLGNYFTAINETTALMRAGKKEMAEMTLFANVAEYQNELHSIVETLRVEKNRSKDSAIDALNEVLSHNVSAISLVTLLSVIVLSLAGSLLYLKITRPVRRMQEEIATIKRTLDLSHRIPVLGASELDQVAGGLNSLLDEFQAIVMGVQNAGNDVAGKSDHLSHSVGQLLVAIEQQNEATASMAASVEEMAVSVSLVSDSSATAHDVAQKSLVSAKEAGTAIEKSVGELANITHDMRTTSKAMEEFERRSIEVGGIAVAIKEIAEQTNLLALNAAIEAARAGEQGRGFAVVADEVRKLSERTALATGKIVTVLGAIQNEAKRAIGDMHRMSGLVGSNAEGTRQTGASIVQLREGSIRVVEVASEMACALKEQSSATNQIARQIESISSMSERNTAGMGEAREVSAELKRLSAAMHQSVVRFQV